MRGMITLPKHDKELRLVSQKNSKIIDTDAYMSIAELNDARISTNALRVNLNVLSPELFKRILQALTTLQVILVSSDGNLQSQTAIACLRYSYSM